MHFWHLDYLAAHLVPCRVLPDLVPSTRSLQFGAFGLQASFTDEAVHLWSMPDVYVCKSTLTGTVDTRFI